ncbi:LysR substrate-binding domain-containing protein [Roseateles sp. SL47]|jgi:LysR family transcriptional regulator, benzoate and cis,cis-muconate-responsive activator of ben and cat genes|uniref:LysR substrate-binding domain-containing protein n=1 Tax=Roseateles sp. SL47 TaxID=2995138 RepID=UPI0022704546|nr:LysR substrate-binding domain-containing protein [Roseateles sp. SL47]WAC72000.1 LysR substrate-binding domain-containing protein [Roseateles sp. SL47]
MRIDIRQLTYFVAVAEEQHIGRAAERLKLSQPPLTRQIQQLESALGVSLFRRTPRGMELNAAGEELLRHARGLLGQLDQAAEQTRRVAQGQIGQLHVGVYGSAVFGLVPEVLRAFRRSHPEVELLLHHAQTPAQIPALRQGRVQVVFERLLPEEPDIEVKRVGSEPLLLALASDHPLAAHRRIDVAALRDQTFLTGSAPAAVATALDLCRAHGFEPRFAPPASDVVTATLLASTGAGVSLVPASMTNVHFPGVVYRKLASRTPATMELYCFYLREDTSPLLRQLLSTIEELQAAPGAGPMSQQMGG